MFCLSFFDFFSKQFSYVSDYDIGNNLPSVIFSVVSATLTIVIGFWIGNLSGKLLIRILKKRDVDKSTHFFLSKILSSFIKIIFVVTALSKLGFNVNSFVAALGAAGITAGLGLKDCISQFASGVLILLNQPFHSGDFIEIEGVKGRVNDIHFMYTTLIMEDNRRVTVPNDHITSNNIINYTSGDIRRIDLVFSIGYDEDISKAKGVLFRVARDNPHILDNPSTNVVVKEHAGSSVNLMCQVWCKSSEYYPALYSMQEAVKLAFDENGIEIPYEQLDVHIKKDNDKEGI